MWTQKAFPSEVPQMIDHIVRRPIGVAASGVAGLVLTLFAGVFTAQRRNNDARKDLPRLLRKRAAMQEVFVSFSHPDIA